MRYPVGDFIKAISSSSRVLNRLPEASIILFLFSVALFFRFHRFFELPEDFEKEAANFFAYIGLIHLGSPVPAEVLNLYPPGTMWPLWGLLTRLSFSIFGISYQSTVLLPQLINACGCVVSYLCFQEIFSRKVGFLAAFFLAVSYWDVSMAKVGRGYMCFDGPLMTAFCWMLYRAATHRTSLWPLRLAGIIFALMLLNGNWYVAGLAFLIAVAFFYVSKTWLEWKRILVVAGYSLGSYILLILVASYFLKIQNPISIPIQNFKIYVLERAPAVAGKSRKFSIEENITIFVRNAFVGAPGDPGPAGWSLDGRPYIPVLMGLMLFVALLGPLSFARASLGKKLLALWILMPLGIYIMFLRIYIHHFSMFIPAVMACCALGMSTMADWIRKRGGGISAFIAGGLILLGVTADSYQTYFRKFFVSSYGNFSRPPVSRMTQHFKQHGIGGETLFVTNMEESFKWVFRIHMRLPSLPMLKVEDLDKWPVGWEGLAFEKGYRRIVYIFSLFPTMRYWKEVDQRIWRQALDRNTFDTGFFSDPEYNFWMRRGFSLEEVDMIFSKDGSHAFYVCQVLPKNARRDPLTPAQRKAILSEIPEPQRLN